MTSNGIWLLVFCCIIVVESSYDSNNREVKRQILDPLYGSNSIGLNCPGSSNPFSYNPSSVVGPLNWARVAPCCGRQYQSPISLVTQQSHCNLPHRITYSLFPVGSIMGQVYNNGHSPQFAPSGQTPILTGVPYHPSAAYVFTKLHLHFGNSLQGGSEHILNGQRFTGEVHLVHYKQEYGSFDNAISQPDGLVVVGVFVQQSVINLNQELRNFVADVTSIPGIDMKKPASYDPRRFLPQSPEFLVYHGSLTTPPCTESVRHIVMRNPINIGTDSLQALFRMPNKEGTTISRYTNARPLQALSVRRVETNFMCF